MSAKYVTLLVVLSLFTFNSHSVKDTIIADWGDIVNVRYSLYLDAAHQEPVSGNVDQPINYIYLSTGGTVPTELLDLYPEANAQFLGGFKAGIVGMKVAETKEVKIDAENGYTNPSDQLYGKDLYFVIILTKLVYDAVIDPSASTTTETTESSTSPIQDITTIALIGGGVAVLAVGVIVWNLRTSRAGKSALSEKKTSTSIRKQSIQKDKDQLKGLREITESLSNSKVQGEGPKVKFQRRRR